MATRLSRWVAIPRTCLIGVAQLPAISRYLQILCLQCTVGRAIHRALVLSPILLTVRLLGDSSMASQGLLIRDAALSFRVSLLSSGAGAEHTSSYPADRREDEFHAGYPCRDSSTSSE